MSDRKPILFVVSAPSGTGKTTLVNRLVETVPGLLRSVSHTTRGPRPGEVHGKDYYFVSESEFQEMVRSGRFLEWKEVHGNKYGTSMDNLVQADRNGSDLVLVIDVQGAREVAGRGNRVCTVFLLPPSLEELKRRMGIRQTESEEEVESRIEAACREIAESEWYQHRVVNDDLETALSQLREIVRGERDR
jgi:guanylate kinase